MDIKLFPALQPYGRRRAGNVKNTGDMGNMFIDDESTKRCSAETKIQNNTAEINFYFSYCSVFTDVVHFKKGSSIS